MSCRHCEEADEKGLVAYFRLRRANIGLIGCEEHLKIAISHLRDGEAAAVVDLLLKDHPDA